MSDRDSRSRVGGRKVVHPEILKCKRLRSPFVRGAICDSPCISAVAPNQGPPQKSATHLRLESSVTYRAASARNLSRLTARSSPRVDKDQLCPHSPKPEIAFNLRRALPSPWFAKSPCATSPCTGSPQTYRSIYIAGYTVWRGRMVLESRPSYPQSTMASRDVCPTQGGSFYRPSAMSPMHIATLSTTSMAVSMKRIVTLHQSHSSSKWGTIGSS